MSAFRAQLGAGLVVRTEVPIGHPRDLRAWDLTTTDRDGTAAAEFETRLNWVAAGNALRRHLDELL